MKTRAEHELLLCVARCNLTESQKSQLDRLLSESLDWGYVLTVARTHGLIPLLHRHIRSSHVVTADSQLATLKQEVFENCQSVLHLLGRLSRLLKLFDKENLPAVVFKGPILSQIAYGDISLRQAGDVDILIEPADCERAKELLESLGYLMVPALTPSQFEAHRKFHCEATFVKDDGFTVIDLHWSLTPKAFPVALRTHEVLSRTQRICVAGINLETFQTEDLILFQCIHGAKHFWSRLESIAALAEVIRRVNHIDWKVVVERAKTARATKMVALGLSLVRQVGDVTVPDSVFYEVDADKSVQVVANDLIANLLSHRNEDYVSVREIGQKYRIIDRKRDLLLSIFRVVFVPTLSDWESIKLRSPWDRLYYIVRPLRLVKSYSVSLSRHFFGERQSPSRSVQKKLSEGLIE